jgi:integrase
MALMTYLLKDRHGTYYFRRVIPPALRTLMPAPWTGKANFKLTLGTKEPSEAKVRASNALRECIIAFQHAERAQRGERINDQAAHSSAPIPIEDIEAEVIADVLAADEAEREQGDDRRYSQTAERRKQWPDLIEVDFGGKGMAEDHAFAYGGHLSQTAKDYRTALVRRQTKIVEGELRAKKRGVPFDPTSDFYRQAGLAMLRGNVRAYDMLLQRQAGTIVETPTPNVDKGPKLSEAFAHWKEGGRTKGAKNPGRNALREAEHALRRFCEWHGDLRLGNIDKAKARDFRDALARVRTRLPHDVLKLPLRDLVKWDMSSLPAAHANTINKSVSLLAAIVAHAMREGRMDRMPSYTNPFQGIKLAVDVREAEGRGIFEAADLKAIFSTPVYANGSRPQGGGGEAAFWLPLIALFTGARQSELAQLRVEDLRQDAESGLWFFDISAEGGRSIKTASSRRKVPAHPHLASIGLLRYRQSLIDRNGTTSGDLWPDIKSDAEGRRAGPWSKWFNRYLRVHAKVLDASKVCKLLSSTSRTRPLLLSPAASRSKQANPRDGAGRYDNPVFGKGVRPVLEQRREVGLLDFQLPVAMPNEVSSIAPTESFASKVKALGITLGDFVWDGREEVLVLTRQAGTRADEIMVETHSAQICQATKA